MKMLLFTLLFAVQAHNWLHPGGPRSRCPKACEQAPTPAKGNMGIRQPHLQVGQGQEFVLEWTTGHPGTSICVYVVHASDEDKVGAHGGTACSHYINNAPAGSIKWTETRFDRMHWSCSYPYGDDWRPGWDDCGMRDFNPGPEGYPEVYERVVDPSEDQYIVREAGWEHPDWDRDKISEKALFAYTADHLKEDIRAEYTNPDYPWIEAVHKFKISSPIGAREWDTARFTITGNQGPGPYMIHVIWGGYSDAVDVDLYANHTPDPYGRYGEEVPVKIEHCQFPVHNPKPHNRCYFFEAGSDEAEAVVQECVDHCLGSGRSSTCSGINIVPLITPENVLHRDTIPPNVPWEPYYVKYLQNQDPTKIPDSCKDDARPSEITANSMVCYGTLVKSPEEEDPAFNPETEREYYIRNDPYDAIFYSTCYTIDREGVFEDNGVCEECEVTEDVPQASPEWRFGDMCLPCDLVGKTTGLYEVTHWETKLTRCEVCS